MTLCLDRLAGPALLDGGKGQEKVWNKPRDDKGEGDLDGLARSEQHALEWASHAVSAPCASACSVVGLSCLDGSLLTLSHHRRPERDTLSTWVGVVKGSCICLSRLNLLACLLLVIVLYVLNVFCFI